MIPAARHALHTLIRMWPDLAATIAAPNTSAWPPAGLRHHLATTSRRDTLEQRTALRALERNPEQLGETAAPINVDVLDTMTTITEALVDCADHVASRVQRPAMSRAPRDWPARDRALRNQAAARDAADPRRWRYVGTRTAPQAARWLDARLAGQPGPFRPLPSLLADRIARTAQDAAARVLAGLELARQSRRLDRPCPHCRAQELRVQGGDGQAPAVACRACGRRWTLTAA